MELASPAADWLPTGGKRPDVPDGTKEIYVRWNDGTSGLLFPQGMDAYSTCFKAGEVCITHYRLAPAQPAEGGCSICERHGKESCAWHCTMPEATPAKKTFQHVTISIINGKLVQVTNGPRCPFCGSTEDNHSCGQILALSKPPPPLHRVTVERERIRFLLEYKGRVPMTEPPRVILSSLPVNAFKEWK